MANLKTGPRHEKMRQRILDVAAQSFFQQGYTNTTIKQIAKDAKICVGSLINIFSAKEELLAAMTPRVYERQFMAARRMIESMTDDQILFFAVETALQLNIVELNENLRDLYSAAYSMPKSSTAIHQTITSKWQEVFAEYLPNCDTTDFYKLEIATCGIMRGFMTVPCDMWFTIDQKVESFLTCTFKLYDVPQKKIREATEFIKQFDFVEMAKKTIESILQ